MFGWQCPLSCVTQYVGRPHANQLSPAPSLCWPAEPVRPLGLGEYTPAKALFNYIDLRLFSPKLDFSWLAQILCVFTGPLYLTMNQPVTSQWIHKPWDAYLLSETKVSSDIGYRNSESWAENRELCREYTMATVVGLTKNEPICWWILRPMWTLQICKISQNLATCSDDRTKRNRRWKFVCIGLQKLEHCLLYLGLGRCATHMTRAMLV